MATRRRKPGEVRDAITRYLREHGKPANIGEIQTAVNTLLGSVPASSVRSYLRLNTGSVFERVGRATYKLKR